MTLFKILHMLNALLYIILLHFFNLSYTVKVTHCLSESVSLLSKLSERMTVAPFEFKLIL